MAKYTSNLNLKKPDQEEFYNVDDFNENCDKIDAFSNRKDNPHSVTAEQVKSLKIYNSFTAMNEDLGTSVSVITPIESIVGLLPDNTGLKADISASDTSIYPAVYGVLTIYKIRANRIEIEYVSNTNPRDPDYNARWVAQYADNRFGGFTKVFTKAFPPTPEDVGALPISGGVLEGYLGVGNGKGTFSATDIYSAYQAIKDGNNFRYLRLINPLYEAYDVKKSLQLVETKDGKETVYNIFGEHNKELMGVSLIGTTRGYSGIGLNYYSMLLKKDISKIEFTFDFPVKFLFLGRRQFVPKGTGDADIKSTEDVYSFHFSPVLNIEAMTNNVYNGKSIPTKVKLTDSTGYAEVIVSEDRKTITVQCEIAVAGMNEEGEYYFYTAIG